LDTLGAQAFGAKDLKSLSAVTQRGVILELILCVPIILTWVFSKPILLYVGQDAEVVGGLKLSTTQPFGSKPRPDLSTPCLYIQV